MQHVTLKSTCIEWLRIDLALGTERAARTGCSRLSRYQDGCCSSSRGRRALSGLDHRTICTSIWLLVRLRAAYSAKLSRRMFRVHSHVE